MNRQVVPPIAIPAVCDLVNGAGPAGGGAAAEEDVVGAAPVGVGIGRSGRVGPVNGSFVACPDVFAAPVGRVVVADDPVVDDGDPELAVLLGTFVSDVGIEDESGLEVFFEPASGGVLEAEEVMELVLVLGPVVTLMVKDDEVIVDPLVDTTSPVVVRSEG